jgi:3-methyladenine DNA glycosylase AlkD
MNVKSRAAGAPTSASGALAIELCDAVAWLQRHATSKTREGLARYGIVAPSALGVTVGDVRALGKRIGLRHDLAGALWATGIYEARLLAAFVADPSALSPAQMDAWCRDFDNWAVCDTVCFHLFDRSPHAFGRVAAWATEREEFVKRAAFALLAGLALHDRRANDAPFVACLPLIEAGASDERNFVKKAVSWALRAVGARSRALHAAGLELAGRLAAAGAPSRASPGPKPALSARWVGKDALRDLSRPLVHARLAAREARAPATPRKKMKKKAKKAGNKSLRRPSRAS